MKAERIPNRPVTYIENTGGTKTTRSRKPMVYRLGPKEDIRVLLWHRWPSYDFIFGVPARSNPYRREEAGFFQYRDTRLKKIKSGFYVDRRELEILSHGFSLLLKTCKRRKR